MKFSRSLILASAIASTQAVAVDYVQRSEDKMAARQRMTLNPEAMPIPFGSFVKSAGGVGETKVLEAKNNQNLGAKRVLIRYGPYNIPSIRGGAIGLALDGTGGMIWNLPHRNVRKPCSNCMITYMHAGLEYPNGETVNTDRGLWLHHMVAINKNGRADATCGWNPASLPHIDVGSSARSAERFFSSGNERTVVDVSMWSPLTAGYYVAPKDNFNFIIDLMNENEKEQKVYMTITWEYVPGKPAGWVDVRPIWFDADQCGISDVKPKSQTQPYMVESRSWTANFDGKLIAMGSHLHDGGDHLEIYRNNKLVCDSVAHYGETPEYRSKAMGTSVQKSKMGGMEMTHISRMTLCGNKPGQDIVGRVKKGDQWVIKGYYDYTKHPGMLNGRGSQSDVMAISIMYAAVPLSARRNLD